MMIPKTPFRNSHYKVHLCREGKKICIELQSIHIFIYIRPFVSHCCAHTNLLRCIRIIHYIYLVSAQQRCHSYIQLIWGDIAGAYFSWVEKMGSSKVTVLWFLFLLQLRAPSHKIKTKTRTKVGLVHFFNIHNLKSSDLPSITSMQHFIVYSCDISATVCQRRVTNILRVVNFFWKVLRIGF